MKIGYILTDFPIWDNSGNIKQLKTASYIISGTNFGNIIIDSGSPYAENEFRADLEKIFKLQPDDINYVIMTHCHPDHMGLSHIFKKAEIIVPKNDYILSKNLIEHFNSGNPIIAYMHKYCGDYKATFTKKDEYNVGRYLSGKWCSPETAAEMNINFIENNPPILNFIKPVITKGHTFDHYSYLIEHTQEPILFCGDAAANRMILLTDNETITEAQMDISSFLESINFIKKFDGILACGHDLPFSTKNFKSFRKNIIYTD